MTTMSRRVCCEFCGRDTRNKCGVCKTCLNTKHTQQEWVDRVGWYDDLMARRDKEIAGEVRQAMARELGIED